MADDLNFTVKSDSAITTQSVLTPSAPSVDTIAAATPASSLDAGQSEAVHKVARDLKRLLGSTSRLKPEAAGHLAQLSKWADDYLVGLEAARKLSENAGGTLGEAQKELSLALEEYLRLEDEGGNVATPQQQRRTDDLSKALRRINTLIPVVQTTFETSAAGPNDPPNPEVETPPPGTPASPEVNPVPMPEGNPDLQPVIPPVDRPEMAKS